LPPDASYFDQLKFDPLLPARVAYTLVRAMAKFLENGYSSPLRVALYLCLCGLAVPAYLRRWRPGPRGYETVAAPTFLPLGLWPFAGWNERYLVPLLPLFFLYACEGLSRLKLPRPAWARPAVVGTLAVALVACYAARYASVEKGPFREGAATAEAVAFFDFIK